MFSHMIQSVWGRTDQPTNRWSKSWDCALIPNMTVIRPADAVETLEAWKYAMENKAGPYGL